MDDLLNRIGEASHRPLLKIVSEDENKKPAFIFTNPNNLDGEEPGEIEKVGDYSYNEEEVLDPLFEEFPDLTRQDIDTKIIRGLNPKLDFDAYSVNRSRGVVSGRLYKL